MAVPVQALPPPAAALPTGPQPLPVCLISKAKDPLRVSSTPFIKAILVQPFEWLRTPTACVELPVDGSLQLCVLGFE